MSQTSAMDTSNTEKWQANDSAHHFHPFTNPNDLLQKPPRIIESAKGVYLTDSDGNQLLDMMAGLWCVNMGYGQQDLIDAAHQQIQQLPYYNAFFKTSTPPTAELSALLSEVTPAHLNHAFFTSSGSEANDTVLRLVWRYWEALLGLDGQIRKTRRDQPQERLPRQHHCRFEPGRYGCDASTGWRHPEHRARGGAQLVCQTLRARHRS
jgi:putrescine aminotransferase